MEKKIDQLNFNQKKVGTVWNNKVITTSESIALAFLSNVRTWINLGLFTIKKSDNYAHPREQVLLVQVHYISPYKTKEHLREVTFDHFCFLNL